LSTGGGDRRRTGKSFEGGAGGGSLITGGLVDKCDLGDKFGKHPL